MPATPLPSVDSDKVKSFAHDEFDSPKAYRICLKYEQQLSTTNQVRLVRILGYLLFYAPNPDIRKEVTECINSCKNETELVDMGEMFETCVLVPFKKYRGPTPATSEFSSSSKFESTKKQMEAEIRQAPKNHKQAKQKALVRDNWRCVVTGSLHRDAPAEVKGPGPNTLHPTECAHIIPEGIFHNVAPKQANEKKRDYSASILAILHRFGYDTAAFNGEKVHLLTNVMTMLHDIHDAFDRLELYFEATSTGVEDSYDIKTFIAPDRYQATQRDSITFTTKDPETHPVPSPKLLALHATCCKVAHLSGAAEHIDTVYEDSDDIGGLASDGTSSDILRYKLLPLENYMLRVGA